MHDLFAPSQESVDGVRSWLESSGVAPNRISQSTNKQWIQFDAAADELEKLLEAEYYLYTHTETARDHVACREYDRSKSQNHQHDANSWLDTMSLGHCGELSTILHQALHCAR